MAGNWTSVRKSSEFSTNEAGGNREAGIHTELDTPDARSRAGGRVRAD
jgi:hypothetical protein